MWAQLKTFHEKLCLHLEPSKCSVCFCVERTNESTSLLPNKTNSLSRELDTALRLEVQNKHQSPAIPSGSNCSFLWLTLSLPNPTEADSSPQCPKGTISSQVTVSDDTDNRKCFICKTEFKPPWMLYIFLFQWLCKLMLLVAIFNKIIVMNNINNN